MKVCGMKVKNCAKVMFLCDTCIITLNFLLSIVSFSEDKITSIVSINVLVASFFQNVIHHIMAFNWLITPHALTGQPVISICILRPKP